MIRSDCVSFMCLFFFGCLCLFLCLTVCFQKAQRINGASDTVFMTKGYFCVFVWMDVFNGCLTICVCVTQANRSTMDNWAKNLQLRGKNFVLDHKVVFIIFNKSYRGCSIFCAKKETICLPFLLVIPYH